MSKIETSPRRVQGDGKDFELLDDQKFAVNDDVEDFKKSRSFSPTRSKIVGGGSRGKIVESPRPALDAEQERKKKEKCQKTTVLIVFALVAVISGILLAVILSGKNGGAGSPSGQGPGVNETSKDPPLVCQTPLEAFSSSIPPSFLVRFVIADLCLNYPELDCFGAPDMSETSLLGATLADGAWQFRDDVGLRVVRQDGHVYIRLEVRHAHDPLGEDRAFVYTVVARSADLCYESFHFYEISKYQTGRFRCSSSIQAAQNHSELVALFLQRPTHFVERRDNAWVFDTPEAKTTIRSFSVPNKDFLVGVQSQGSSSARFLMDQARAFSMIGSLDADARSPGLANTCVEESGWARQTMSPLPPRMLSPDVNPELDGVDEETGICSTRCTNSTSSGESLEQVSSCIQACIEESLTGAEQGIRRRRLETATDVDLTPGEDDDGGELFTRVFQTSAKLSATLLTDKLRQRDEDERLRLCIAPNGTEEDRTRLEHSARLLSALGAVELELDRLQIQLDELDQSLIDSITFVSGIVSDAYEAMGLMTQYRARVYPYLYSIRMYSSRESTVTMASSIIAELESTFEPGFREWANFLQAMAWNGTAEELASLQDLQIRVEDARTNALALNMFMKRYLVPFVRARAGSPDVNAVAGAIASEMSILAAMYSRISIDSQGLPALRAIVTNPNLMSLMREFMEAASEGVAFFRQAAQKLEVAMNSQVSLMFTATRNKRLIRINDACAFDFGPSCIARGESCRIVSSGLVQSFNTPVTSLVLSRCSTQSTPRSDCTVARASNCDASVQVPVVSRKLRTRLIKVALRMPGTKNDLIEDTVENALRFWSNVVAFPEGAPVLPATDHSALLLRALAFYQDPPSTELATCISTTFTNNPLSCTALRPLMDVLDEYCDQTAGESCLLDSNCRSGSCRGDICCAGAHVNCPTRCVAPSGTCFTGAPSRTPSLGPTARPTKTTRSPTQATSNPSRTPTTDQPSTSPTRQPSSHPTSKFSTPGPTVRPTTSSPTKRGKTSSPTRTKRPTTSPTLSRPTTSPIERAALPTKMPTTRRPTIEVTSQPSASPTRRPSFPPTKSPIITRSPTQEPTDSPTLRPTLAPIVTLCQRPRTTCEAIRNKPECDQWSGCGWNSEVDICWTQDCSEFSCRVRQQSFQASSIILPGCRLGDELACDKQRLQAFNGLKLAEECSASFIPVRRGGWLGKEQILPLFPAVSSDVFVSAGSTGSDSTGTGSRLSPFKTLERALVETRKDTPRIRRKIILLPGEPYRVKDTVRLGPADSGLVIQGETQARTGLRPRITSSIPLQGARWEVFRDSIIRTKLTTEMVAALDDLSALYIDDQPAIRSRHPNLDDPLSFRYSPAGIVSAWGRPRTSPPLFRRENRVMIPADNPGVRYHRASIPYNRFSAGYGGACSHFDPPVSYFCDPAHFAQGGCPYSLPSSVSFSRSPFAGRFWAKPQTAYFHSLHWYGWGLWTFRVRAQTPFQVIFDRGGWQEARGDCGIGGSGWYVENVMELLDHPNEYFIDLDDGYLYYIPNTPQRNPMLNPSAKIELTTAVRRFIEVIGESKTRPVRDVTIRNIEFFGAHATHMDPFIAPSGGDWTIHRGGAVHLEHVEDSRVQGNFFLWCSGNALFLNRHIRRVDVQFNDFWGIGSTAIAVVGDPNWESAEPWKITDYAEDVRIFANVAAELGLIVKQSAGSFVTLGKRVLVEQNVFYDGPRGGIVFNDGFGGGHIVRRNVIFQFVLETNDHGPFDTWDRQQYDEPTRPVNIVDWNIFLGTAPGPKGIDFDDGTYNWISEHNVVVWGYQKFKGSHIQARNNLILYPLASSCAFFTPQNRVPANWVWENNTCVSYRPPYGYNAGRAEITTLCEPSNFRARFNNYFYLGNEGQFESCTVSPLSWGEWRARYSQDFGSIFSRRSPLVSEMEEWVRAKLIWVEDVMRGVTPR